MKKSDVSLKDCTNCKNLVYLAYTQSELCKEGKFLTCKGSWYLKHYPSYWKRTTENHILKEKEKRDRQEYLGDIFKVKPREILKLKKVN